MGEGYGSSEIYEGSSDAKPDCKGVHWGFNRLAPNDGLQGDLGWYSC